MKRVPESRRKQQGSQGIQMANLRRRCRLLSRPLACGDQHRQEFAMREVCSQTGLETTHPHRERCGDKGPKFGIGIEMPDAKAILPNNTLNADQDQGHTIAYIREADGKISNVASFGPSVPIGVMNKTEFKGGDIAGNPHWPITENLKTWEVPITAEQKALAISAMSELKNNPPHYTPEMQCTSAALRIASAAGISMPSGVGPVVVQRGFITAYSANLPNPYKLSVDMEQKFGPGKTLEPRAFPKP